MDTLPDYLQAGLDLVLVGINPGLTSAQVGHYFANPRNRFWAAFNAAEMTPERLGPTTDFHCLRYGIGFTDVVKRPTKGMAELKGREFVEGVVVLREKLLQHQPRVVCFNGVSGYRHYANAASPHPREITTGLQTEQIGLSRIWVLPSTSPANASVSLERIVASMRALKAFLIALREAA